MGKLKTLIQIISLVIIVNWLFQANYTLLAQSYDIDMTKAVSIEWSPNGEFLASAHSGGIVLWDGDTGAIVNRIVIRNMQWPVEPYISDVAWSPDSTELAVRLIFPSASVIQVLAVPGGTLRLDNIDGGSAEGLDWSPDGSRLALTYQPFINAPLTIRIIDSMTGDQIQEFPVSQRDTLSDLAWSPDGNYLVANLIRNSDSAFVVWDGNTGQELVSIPYEGLVYDFDWSPDSDKVVVTIENDAGSFIQAWSINSGEVISSYSFPVTSEIDWHPTGDLWATTLAGLATGGAAIIDANSGSLLYKVPEFSFYSKWKPDGAMLATMRQGTPQFMTIDGDILPQFPIVAVFGIFDSHNDTFLDIVENQQTIDASSYANVVGELQIHAVTNTDTVQKIIFELDGQEFVDEQAPFAIPLPSAGTYTLSAIPFTTQNGITVEGSAWTIIFTNSNLTE